MNFESITINNSTMIIDILPLINYKKINGYNDILHFLKVNLLNITEIYIHVGKGLTIGLIERNMTFIKKLCIIFYNLPEDQIKKCNLLNTPKTFSSIFSFIKPLLTKNAINKIQVIDTTLNQIQIGDTL